MKSSNEAHTYQIKEYLIRGATITQLDAIERFGCFRLAARIYDIRKAGLDVHKIMVKTAQGRMFAKYYLSHGISPNVYGYYKGVIE